MSRAVEMMPSMTALWVGIAGLGGVLARYAVSTPFHGDTLPWVTVAINVVGSFLLGALVTAHAFSDELRTALGVGFLGGFTTFSTFSVQAVLDVEAGEPGRAALYVAASVGLGLMAAAAGYAVGRSVL
jgi:CrcB protein